MQKWAPANPRSNEATLDHMQQIIIPYEMQQRTSVGQVDTLVLNVPLAGLRQSSHFCVGSWTFQTLLRACGQAGVMRRSRLLTEATLQAHRVMISSRRGSMIMKWRSVVLRGAVLKLESLFQCLSLVHDKCMRSCRSQLKGCFPPGWSRRDYGCKPPGPLSLGLAP